MRDENIMLRAVGRAKINELVDVILNTRLAENGVGDQRGAHAADGKPIRARSAIDMICRLPASARAHMLDRDRRISRNMFTQEICNRPCPQVGRAARRAAQNDCNRFVLIKRRL